MVAITSQPLTAERLRELLHYDPKTGIFTRRVTVNSVARAGDVCGGDDSHGYLQVKIDRRGYRLNRLAWLYMTGDWPAGDVDHRDTIRTNNCWTNLRDVSHRVNAQNLRKATSKSKTGFLGVVKKGNRFDANIKTNGKAKYLGSYSQPDQAHAAYLAAKRELHQGCTI